MTTAGHHSPALVSLPGSASSRVFAATSASVVSILAERSIALVGLGSASVSLVAGLLALILISR